MMSVVKLMIISAFAASAIATAAGQPSNTKSSVTMAVGPGALPIVNDNYERARAEANKRELPMFVEVWAPW